MYSAKTFADRLLLERRNMKWDQADLAERSGISRGYISEIERGIKKNVGVEIVVALAEALGVSPQYLMGLSESPLGESDARVLREMAREYVTVDVDSDEERRLVRSLMDEFNMLPRRAQQAAIEMIRLLRRMETDEPLRGEDVD